MKRYALLLTLLQGTISISASEYFSVSKVIKATANQEAEEIYHGVTTHGTTIFSIRNKKTGDITSGWYGHDGVYEYDNATKKDYFLLLSSHYRSATKKNQRKASQCS